MSVLRKPWTLATAAVTAGALSFAPLAHAEEPQVNASPAQQGPVATQVANDGAATPAKQVIQVPCKDVRRGNIPYETHAEKLAGYSRGGIVVLHYDTGRPDDATIFTEVKAGIEDMAQHNVPTKVLIHERIKPTDETHPSTQNPTVIFINGRIWNGDNDVVITPENAGHIIQKRLIDGYLAARARIRDLKLAQIETRLSEIDGQRADINNRRAEIRDEVEAINSDIQVLERVKGQLQQMQKDPSISQAEQTSPSSEPS